MIALQPGGAKDGGGRGTRRKGNCRSQTVTTMMNPPHNA